MTTLDKVVVVLFVWFVVSCVVVGGLYWLAVHLQERRRKALERWHCPPTLPEDWSLMKEKL